MMLTIAAIALWPAASVGATIDLNTQDPGDHGSTAAPAPSGNFTVWIDLSYTSITFCVALGSYVLSGQDPPTGYGDTHAATRQSPGP